jgi:AcrR family transcriptional regulator
MTEPPSAPTQSRRERLRAQTLAEIREHALAQIDEGGPQALSLNAIGKAMGMSGPALYRYFKSRDDLVAALVAECYVDLVAALERASADTARRTPAKRLAAVAFAYRRWVLDHPRRYAMLFNEPVEQRVEDDAAIDEIHGGMRILLQVIGEAHGDGGPDAQAGALARRGDKLDQQLSRWAGRHDTAAPALVLRLGVLTWTRLHGIVSLELAGVFADMGLDAELLLGAEVDAAIAAAAPDRV